MLSNLFEGKNDQVSYQIKTVLVIHDYYLQVALPTPSVGAFKRIQKFATFLRRTSNKRSYAVCPTLYSLLRSTHLRNNCYGPHTGRRTLLVYINKTGSYRAILL